MQHRRLWMPIAAFLAAASSSTLHAYSPAPVYSAAGELPSQRMARLAEERAEADARQLVEEAERVSSQRREQLLAAAPPLPRPEPANTPPPLPRQQATATPPPLPSQQPLPAQQVASLPDSAAASMSVPAAAPAAPVRTAPKIERDFLAATSDDVTIDVIDMPLEEVLTTLAPAGWRLRFQRVGDEVLASSTDLTATNATRGEVLHELLSRAGLAAEPFPEFDVPLLIVSRQGGL